MTEKRNLRSDEVLPEFPPERFSGRGGFAPRNGEAEVASDESIARIVHPTAEIGAVAVFKRFFKATGLSGQNGPGAPMAGTMMMKE